jgi:hypothetical protein
VTNNWRVVQIFFVLLFSIAILYTKSTRIPIKEANSILIKVTHENLKGRLVGIDASHFSNLLQVAQPHSTITMNLFLALILLTLARTVQAAATRNMQSTRAANDLEGHHYDPLPPSLRELSDEEKLLRLKEGRSLSFTEIGARDDREALNFCSTFLGMLNFSPDYVDCTCTILLFVNISFKCQASLCVSSLEKTLNNFTMFQQNEALSKTVSAATDVVTKIVGDPCIAPSYRGDIYTPVLGLKSEVCNDPISLNVTLPATQKATIPPFQLDLPEVCASIRHKSLTDIIHAKMCEFRIGEFDCNCTVCESGQDVSLDCTNSLDLGQLAPYAKFECVGFGIFGLNNAGTPQALFVNPVLLLGKLVWD